MSTHSVPLAIRLLPRATVARDVAMIVGGAAVTAVAAQVFIPWNPVPFTMQTFSVCLCGLTLGSTRGFLSMLLYTLAGAVGLPVFVGGERGVVAAAGPLGGYLLAFMIAAWLLGKCAERGWDRSVPKTLGAMLMVQTLILGLGSLWLAFSIGSAKAFEVGALVFVGPELMKAVLASLVLPGARRLLGA